MILLLFMKYAEMALTASSTAGACELWRLVAKWPCIGREQMRMFKKLVLAQLPTDCLFGTITESIGAAPEDRRRKCF